MRLPAGTAAPGLAGSVSASGSSSGLDIGYPSTSTPTSTLLALAERSKSWPDSEVFLCAKLGTIIDAAVIVNGEPIRGASRMAGEPADIKVGDHLERRTCGEVGCLDAIASGAALVRQLEASGINVQHASHVIKMANEGVPVAVHAVRDAGRYIGEALSAVVNLLNPDAIAIRGYLADAEALLFSDIRERIYRAPCPIHRTTDVDPCDAGAS